MLHLTCQNCGKEFERYPSQLVSNNIYCSRKCQNQGRLIHIYECELCKATFHRPIGKTQRKPRFCSPKCMYAVLKVERNVPNCKCKECGKEFRKTPFAIAHGEGRFCSRACKNIEQTGKYDGDKPVHYYSLANWKRLRLTILERDNYTCIRCNKQTTDLQINHIRFRELGGSDSPSNLESLCRPCHAKTDSDKLKELTGNDKARMRDYKNFFIK